MTTVGIVGGGQLARMLALAAAPLGLQVVVADADPTACAGEVAERVDDPLDLAARCDVITVEHDHVSTELLDRLAERVPVRPSSRSIAAAGDRLVEKALLERVGLSVPAHAPVDSEDDLRAAVERTGLPAILKTRRGGYDGRGQARVATREDAAAALADLGGSGLILEEQIDFERELALVSVRSATGERRFWPLVETRQRGGIMRESVAPANGVSAPLQRAAEQAAGRILDELDHVGALALELFERDGELVGNEIAPRVHNAGHWTLDGAATSQFENHLRAVVGWPLGDTAATASTLTVNLIGTTPPAADVLAVERARLHLYGKAPRPGRKLGHVNLPSSDDELRGRLLDLASAEEAATSRSSPPRP